MRFIITAFVIVLFANVLNAQNFEPQPSTSQEKIEKSLNRLGSFERVYLTDTNNKIFEAKPGAEYIGWFVFDRNSTATRRMMIIQLGTQGEKVKIHYPKFNQAIKDLENQGFVINFIAPDAQGIIKYRVDASPECSVYLYQLTRGVKRD